MSGYPNYNPPPPGYRPPTYAPPGQPPRPAGGGGSNGCVLAAIIVLVVVGVPMLAICGGVGYFVYFVRTKVEEAKVQQEERNRARELEVADAAARQAALTKPIENVDEAIAALNTDDGNRAQQGVNWLIANPVDAAKRAFAGRALERHLSFHKQSLANDCLRALDKWGGKENASAVAKSLQEHGLDKRLACDLLGKWKDVASTGALVELLNDSGATGDAAENALAQIGPVAKPAVCTQLVLDRRTAHARAEKLLAGYGADVDDEIITARLTQLKRGDGFRHSEVLKSLAAMTLKPQRQTDVARALDAVVASADVFTRDEALKALVVWADEDSIPPLVRLVKADGNPNKTALRLVAQFKDPSGLQALAGLIDNFFIGDEDYKSALVGYGADAEKAVLPSFNDSRDKARQRARAVLTALDTKPDVLFAQSLKDLASEDHRRVEKALEWLSTATIDESKYAELAAKLAAPAKNFITEKQALEILVKCNSPIAAKTLAEFIKDRGKKGRVDDAFRKAGTDSEGVLLALLENADPVVAYYACTGLKDYGSEKAVAPLQAVSRKAGSGNKQLATEARTAADTIKKRLGM